MNEELIKAIELIQDECIKHKYCKLCPLFSRRGCMLRVNFPDAWSVGGLK